MRIAACQMVSGLNAEENVIRAVTLIGAGAESGAELVVLPEHFAFLPQDDFALLGVAEDFGDGPIQEAVRMAAVRHRIWVAAGSIPLKTEDPARITNSLLVYDPKGDAVARYDRIHCFRYARGNEEFYDEARVMRPGRKAVSFTLTTWDGRELTVGLALGFDLRFPELFRALDPVDLQLLPATFTETTGRAHWATLLAARAVENQCYVVAAAQGGTHESGRRTWGHSRIVDPWGNLAAEFPAGEGIVIGDFDERLLRSVRGMLPALEARSSFE